MIRKTRLFTPGPTPLLPAAQFAMAAADIHHRTPEFRTLYQRVLGQLKEFVGTKNDVIILSSSGTGAMEASVSNLTSPGDRVLVLTSGKFGERWSALAKAFGCEVDVVSAPYGETFTLDAVKAALASGHLCATDLADFLVQRGLPFREAHHVVGAIVREAETRNVQIGELPADVLVAAHPSLHGPELALALKVSSDCQRFFKTSDRLHL